MAQHNGDIALVLAKALAASRICVHDWTFSSRTRRSSALIAAGAWLLVSSAHAAVVVPNSTSLVFASGFCRFGLEGCLRAGASDASDVQNKAGLLAVEQATASPLGPNASVQGEYRSSSQPNLDVPPSITAAAEVTYEVLVQPVGAGLVLKVQSVPVHLDVNVEVTAIGEAFAFASAGSIPAALGGGGVSACAGMGCNPAGNRLGATRLTGSVSPNSALSIVLLAEGDALGKEGSFEAGADPIFSIDDALIPGTDINFRDAFSVVVSPDVTEALPTAAGSVPEPGTLSLFLLALAGIFPLTLKRRRVTAG